MFQIMEPKLVKEEIIEKDNVNYIDTSTNSIRTRSSKGGWFYFQIYLIIYGLVGIWKLSKHGIQFNSLLLNQTVKCSPSHKIKQFSFIDWLYFFVSWNIENYRKKFLINNLIVTPGNSFGK